MIDLPQRLMANSTDVIANISSNRIANFFNYSFGGMEYNHTQMPNFGLALFEVVSVYPDYLGMVAWFVLFAIPFIMMWLTHSDVVPAAVLGLFLGIYIVGFIGPQYMVIGVAVMAVAVTSIIWSLWLRRL